MSEVRIDARQFTNQSAETLGNSLSDYFRIEHLRLSVGRKSDVKQELILTGENLHLQVQDDILVTLLLLLNNQILMKVDEIS